MVFWFSKGIVQEIVERPASGSRSAATAFGATQSGMQSLCTVIASRSDAAIQQSQSAPSSLDCFASLAMTAVFLGTRRGLD